MFDKNIKFPKKNVFLLNSKNNFVMFRNFKTYKNIFIQKLSDLMNIIEQEKYSFPVIF